MATWYEAGAYVIDTGIDDPARSDPNRGYAYTARVRAKTTEQVGASGGAISGKWLLSGQVAIGVPFGIGPGAASVSADNLKRRIYIVVRALCSHQAGGSPTDYRLIALEWELVRTT